MIKDDRLDEIIREHHGSKKGFARHYLTLYSIILGMEAKSVLEVGAGFSTPTILKALEITGGTLMTCDMRPIEGTGNKPESLKKYSNWKYLQGKTEKTLKDLIGPFDVVLHDGTHEFRDAYRDLRRIIPLVKKNGLILVHDTEHRAFRLKLAVKLATLFCRHEKATLPYGYGLTIIRILGNGQNGSVITTWEKNRSKEA